VKHTCGVKTAGGSRGAAGLAVQFGVGGNDKIAIRSSCDKHHTAAQQGRGVQIARSIETPGDSPVPAIGVRRRFGMKSYAVDFEPEAAKKPKIASSFLSLRRCRPSLRSWARPGRCSRRSRRCYRRCRCSSRCWRRCRCRSRRRGRCRAAVEFCTCIDSWKI
jgi:hypothetical protein